MKRRKTIKGEPIFNVEATIYCSRESHKAIIIGKNGEMLKQLSIEYSVDRSILSRVKNNKTWKYAYEILNKRNAQRLSKAPLKEW